MFLFQPNFLLLLQNKVLNFRLSFTSLVHFNLQIKKTNCLIQLLTTSPILRPIPIQIKAAKSQSIGQQQSRDRVSHILYFKLMTKVVCKHKMIWELSSISFGQNLDFITDGRFIFIWLETMFFWQCEANIESSFCNFFFKCQSTKFAFSKVSF